jgi:hypothetical protein
VEHVGRRAVLLALPIERSGTPPGWYVNLTLLALMILGLGLSLMRRGGASAPATVAHEGTGGP